MKTRNPRPGQYELFGKVAATIGTAAVIVGIGMHSFVPIIVAGIAIFCTLCFINGLR